MWFAGLISAISCGGQPSPELDVPSADQAWVATACDPVSVDTTGWRRERLGDLTIAIPPEYVNGPYQPYTLGFRGPLGAVRMLLHRDARYSFDADNRARRGQNWCNGILGGYQAEVLAWRDQFRGANYNLSARVLATWGGQDEGKWLYINLKASRLRDAYRMRDALHTLASVRDSMR